MGMRTGGRKPPKSPQNRFFRPVPALGGRGGGGVRAYAYARVCGAGAAQRGRRVLNIIFYPLFSPPPPPRSLSPPHPPIPIPPLPPQNTPSDDDDDADHACVREGVREGKAAAGASAQGVKAGAAGAGACMRTRAREYHGAAATGRRGGAIRQIVQNGKSPKMPTMRVLRMIYVLIRIFGGAPAFFVHANQYYYICI